MTKLPQHKPNIWVVDGGDVPFMGLPYPTRMTIMKLENGELVVHSPIELTPALKSQVDELGTVKYLVSPNKIHYLFIPEWKRQYPEATSFASPGLQERVHDFTFDEHISESGTEFAFSQEVDYHVFQGSKVMSEVVFFHKPSKTLILADLIENFDPQSEGLNCASRLLMRATGILHPDGQAPLDFRASFVFGKAEARESLNQIMAWEPESVVIAHGIWAKENGMEFVKHGFRWLL